MVNPAVIERIRLSAAEIGFDAYNASCFVANPYEYGTDFYEAWGDGYDLGVHQGRDMITARNDNHGLTMIDPSHYATPEGIWLHFGS